MTGHSYTYDPALPPPPPYAKILFCPLCGHELHRLSDEDQPYEVEEYAAFEKEVARACFEHLRSKHKWRYRLWKHTRWDWVTRGLTA